MKTKLLILLLLCGSLSYAQVTRVSLQASGLTCSMCSNAVKKALEGVSFIEKVQVDIKNQQYNLSFKKDVAVDFDALVKSVEDAGFSVAKLTVTANVENLKVEKDGHVKIGDAWVHFLNASGQTLNGAASFTLVDKGFVPPKALARYSALSKKECVKSGRTASCCTAESVPGQTRIYHAII